MKLYNRKTCRCGADCAPGTDVRMERVSDPRQGWQVVACPACADSCDRGQVVMGDQRRVTSLREAIANRKARERKKRERRDRKADG